MLYQVVQSYFFFFLLLWLIWKGCSLINVWCIPMSALTCLIELNGYLVWNQHCWKNRTLWSSLFASFFSFCKIVPIVFLSCISWLRKTINPRRAFNTDVLSNIFQDVKRLYTLLQALQTQRSPDLNVSFQNEFDQIHA